MLAVHDCCHIIVDMYAFPKLILLFFNNQDVAALKFARKTVQSFSVFWFGSSSYFKITCQLRTSCELLGSL